MRNGVNHFSFGYSIMGMRETLSFVGFRPALI
jgi:hypothetical protein